MLNGLWLKSTFPVSSFSSNIGKSVIQQKRNAPVSPRSSSSASRVRTAPANFAAVSTLPATKNTASPAARPQDARIASARSGSRLRAIGPFGPSAS